MIRTTYRRSRAADPRTAIRRTPVPPIAGRRSPAAAGRRRGVFVLRLICALGLAVAAATALAPPAFAATASPPSLNSVIGSLQVWLVGILAGLATLFLTIGGIRYLTAGGDPAEVERAKTALKSAAVGYALAALAPLLVSILQSIVG